jgi:hypothetical protein
VIRLPFGLCIVPNQTWDTVVDHVARLLAERCRLIVGHEQDTAIIAVQQRTIIALDAEIAHLRSAVADADRLLGL